MKSKLMPSIVLSAICLVVALLLSVVNMVTAPIIAEIQANKANAALLEVLPNGKNFTEVDVTLYDLPAEVNKAYKADGGYVFQLTEVGYKAGLTIVVGVGTDGKIAGVKHIASNETYGLEAGLNQAYVGKELVGVEKIIAQGATEKSATSSAYYKAMQHAEMAYQIIGLGEDVDTRTPEEILQDDCNALFGTEGKTFSKWFAVEVIDPAIKAVYIADGVGRVYLVGDSKIGVDTTGAAKYDSEDATITEDVLNTVTGADGIIAASTLSEVAGATNEHVTKVEVTASGNYVFTVNGEGYGINGGYKNSGKYMVLKIAITSDGKIIETMVVSHKETDSYGGVAFADPEFMGQFVGTDKNTIGSANISSGATITLNGYKEAISWAFEVFETLTGGENA